MTETAAPALEPGVTLTEQILRRLPGPQLLWIVIWAGVAVVRLGALFVTLDVAGLPLPDRDYLDSAERQVVFGYAVAIALAGTPILSRRIRELEPALDSLSDPRPTGGWFNGLTSIRGPVALTLLTVAASMPSTLTTFGREVALVDVVFLTIVVLPLMIFVWAYAALLVGLDRLGRARLRLEAFPEDRGLGLGPIGSAATLGFWLVIVATAPLLLVAGSDLVTVATSVTVIGVVVALFVLSMVRLHGQMRAAKNRYIAMTRALVEEAYAPIRATANLETLQSRASALGAAQALADRADKLLEWPVDERMVTWMTVVVTGVVTSVIVRFVLQAVGA